MGFSRQEYWSGLPFPSPGDLPDPGIEPASLTLQADAYPLQYPWAGDRKIEHKMMSFNVDQMKPYDKSSLTEN